MIFFFYYFGSSKMINLRLHLNIFSFWKNNKSKKISHKKCLPRSTIFPNKFFPRKKFRVEQFHRRFRNWCWHSLIAILALLTSAANTPGFSLTKRRCFRRNVVWTAGSIYMIPDVNGDILFGSPTFAMPLVIRKKQKRKKKRNEKRISLVCSFKHVVDSIAHRIRIVMLLRMLVQIDGIV